MRARRQPDDGDCVVFVAGDHPVPRQAVNRDMQMTDPRRYAESGRPEHRYQMHVHDPVLDLDEAASQGFRKRRVDDHPRRGLALDGVVW